MVYAAALSLYVTGRANAANVHLRFQEGVNLLHLYDVRAMCNFT